MRRIVLAVLMVISNGCTGRAEKEAGDEEIAGLKKQMAEIQLKLTKCNNERPSGGALGAVAEPSPSKEGQMPGVFGILARGYSPEEARQIRYQITSAMNQRAEIMSRTLGYDIRNSRGSIDMAMTNRVVRDFRRRAIKVFGKNSALKVLRNQWGDLAGSAIYNTEDTVLSSAID